MHSERQINDQGSQQNERVHKLADAKLTRPREMQESVCFFDPRKNPDNGWLSNFSQYKITVDGVEWQTTEYIYQAYKFKGTAPEVVKQIHGAATNRIAKRTAHANMEKVRSDWMTIKDDVMRLAIATKLQQHREELAPKLLATGHRRIVEDSPFDYYWGVGAEGTGRNMLGRIWMEVRQIQQREERLPSPETAHDRIPEVLQTCRALADYINHVGAVLGKKRDNCDFPYLKRDKS